eukprot:g65650.t1
MSSQRSKRVTHNAYESKSTAREGAQSPSKKKKEKAPNPPEEEEYEVPSDDDIGYQGNYECTRHFNATIKMGSRVVGTVEAFLIDRPGPFHCAVTPRAKTSSLWAAACSKSMFYSSSNARRAALLLLLHDASGTPRLKELREDFEAQEGGFLYISTFSIEGAQEDDDFKIRTDAVGQLLRHPDFDLASRWTVAAHVPETKRGGTETERASAISADARPFLSLGFQEASLAGSDRAVLYVTHTLLRAQPIPEAKAQALQLRTFAPKAGCAAPPSGVDHQLLEVVIKSKHRDPVDRATFCETDPASFLARMDALRRNGADLNRAAALHAAAANHLPFFPVTSTHLSRAS